MEKNVEIPQLGESITEATLIKWLKSDGEQVSTDEPLCELETDKATVELPAPATGKVKHLKKEGTQVKIGESVATIEEQVEGKKEAAPEPAPQKKEKPKAVEPKAAKEKAPPKPQEPAETKEDEEPEVEVEKKTVASAAPGEEEKAEPEEPEQKTEPESKAEKKAPLVATEKEAAEPETPEPELVREEIPTKEKAEPREPKEEMAEVKRIPMSRIRRAIADRLVRSQHEAAILTTFNEADMSEVLAIRERHGEEFKRAHGVSLGLMSFFVRAVTSALREFPVLNASVEGNDIAYHRAVHMGIAVSTDRGLVVPVLKNADSMSFSKIESEIQRIAETARDGKLSLSEISGGTFTITNGGVFGSLLSTPLLHPPQAGILGMHTIQKRAHVLADDRIEARPMMYLALSYDHRLVDGREAVLFLISVKNFIEDPVRFLLSEERFSTSDKTVAVDEPRSSAA